MFSISLGGAGRFSAADAAFPAFLWSETRDREGGKINDQGQKIL